VALFLVAIFVVVGVAPKFGAVANNRRTAIVAVAENVVISESP
jgi:hypothetical protein